MSIGMIQLWIKDLCEKVLVHPVFLCPVVRWKRIGPAHDLIKISHEILWSEFFNHQWWSPILLSTLNIDFLNNNNNNILQLEYCLPEQQQHPPPHLEYCLPQQQQQQQPPLHLENCLPEVIVGIFAFSETLEAEIAKIGKVDQTFPVMKNIKWWFFLSWCW